MSIAKYLYHASNIRKKNWLLFNYMHIIINLYFLTLLCKLYCCTLDFEPEAILLEINYCIYCIYCIYRILTIKCYALRLFEWNLYLTLIFSSNSSPLIRNWPSRYFEHAISKAGRKTPSSFSLLFSCSPFFICSLKLCNTVLKTLWFLWTAVCAYASWHFKRLFSLSDLT